MFVWFALHPLRAVAVQEWLHFPALARAYLPPAEADMTHGPENVTPLRLQVLSLGSGRTQIVARTHQRPVDRTGNFPLCRSHLCHVANSGCTICNI